MGYKDEIFYRRLREEADQWIEREMEARMGYASEEIETQADVGSNLFGDSTIKKHMRDATAYAEQEIRRGLEMEAEKRIEEELKKHTEQVELKYKDVDLEGRSC
jgi:hypothetical protein